MLDSDWFREIIESHFADIVILSFHAGYEDNEMKETVSQVKKIVAETFSGYDVPIHVVAGYDHQFYSGPCHYNSSDLQCYCVDAGSEMKKLAHTVWTLEDAKIDETAYVGKHAQSIVSFNQTDFILEKNGDEEGLLDRFNMTKQQFSTKQG